MPSEKEGFKLRRSLLKSVAGLGGLFAIGEARAWHTDTHMDETTRHRMLYQCNKADPEYLQHILFSTGELLRKYGDDIEIVITAFGPGIHIIGKRPGRPVPPDLQERATSLASYGVAWHACGNTMKALGWAEKDLLDFATVVPIGVDDMMQLQERGFSYVSW